MGGLAVRRGRLLEVGRLLDAGTGLCGLLACRPVRRPVCLAATAERKDKIAAVFDEIVRSAEAFSGELLYDFRHRLSCGKASRYRPEASKTELLTDISRSWLHSQGAPGVVAACSTPLRGGATC